MYKYAMLLLGCSLTIVGCNFEHLGDCEDDELELDEPNEGDGKGQGKGASSTGPDSSGGSDNARAGSPASVGGTQASSGGGAGGVGLPPDPPSCDEESDCEPASNCDTTLGQCLPTNAETCAELKLETDCGVRSDCTAIYAGIGCSCGQDCECVGGEPGCICESFEFFACGSASM